MDFSTHDWLRRPYDSLSPSSFLFYKKGDWECSLKGTFLEAYEKCIIGIVKGFIKSNRGVLVNNLDYKDLFQEAVMKLLTIESKVMGIPLDGRKGYVAKVAYMACRVIRRKYLTLKRCGHHCNYEEMEDHWMSSHDADPLIGGKRDGYEFEQHGIHEVSPDVFWETMDRVEEKLNRAACQ